MTTRTSRSQHIPLPDNGPTDLNFIKNKQRRGDKTPRRIGRTEGLDLDLIIPQPQTTQTQTTETDHTTNNRQSTTNTPSNTTSKQRKSTSNLRSSPQSSTTKKDTHQSRTTTPTTNKSKQSRTKSSASSSSSISSGDDGACTLSDVSDENHAGLIEMGFEFVPLTLQTLREDHLLHLIHYDEYPACEPLIIRYLIVYKMVDTSKRRAYLKAHEGEPRDSIPPWCRGRTVSELIHVYNCVDSDASGLTRERAITRIMSKHGSTEEKRLWDQLEKHVERDKRNKTQPFHSSSFTKRNNDSSLRTATTSTPAPATTATTPTKRAYTFKTRPLASSKPIAPPPAPATAPASKSTKRRREPSEPSDADSSSSDDDNADEFLLTDVDRPLPDFGPPTDSPPLSIRFPGIYAKCCQLIQFLIDHEKANNQYFDHVLVEADFMEGKGSRISKVPDCGWSEYKKRILKKREPIDLGTMLRKLHTDQYFSSRQLKHDFSQMINITCEFYYLSHTACNQRREQAIALQDFVVPRLHTIMNEEQLLLRRMEIDQEKGLTKEQTIGTSPTSSPAPTSSSSSNSSTALGGASSASSSSTTSLSVPPVDPRARYFFSDLFGLGTNRIGLSKFRRIIHGEYNKAKLTSSVEELDAPIIIGQTSIRWVPPPSPSTKSWERMMREIRQIHERDEEQQPKEEVPKPEAKPNSASTHTSSGAASTTDVAPMEIEE